MTQKRADWTGPQSRARGFVAGFCVGDALAPRPEQNEGSRVANRLSRVFLNQTSTLDWALRCDVNLLDRRAGDAPQDRRADRGLPAADLVLARSMPLALAVITRYARTLPHLSPVNGGWLNLLVERGNPAQADASAVAVAQVLVRSAARRLNGEPTPGLDAPESLATFRPLGLDEDSGPVHDLITRLDTDSRTGQNLDLPSYGAPGQPVRIAAEALALLSALESTGETTERVGLARDVRPSVAAPDDTRRRRERAL